MNILALLLAIAAALCFAAAALQVPARRLQALPLGLLLLAVAWIVQLTWAPYHIRGG